jgi:hypothetical protein
LDDEFFEFAFGGCFGQDLGFDGICRDETVDNDRLPSASEDKTTEQGVLPLFDQFDELDLEPVNPVADSNPNQK